MSGLSSNNGPTVRGSTEPRAQKLCPLQCGTGILPVVFPRSGTCPDRTWHRNEVSRLARGAINPTPGTDDLFYIGITHRSAPLAVREHLHASTEKQRAMLTRLARLAPGRLVLATCERLEMYASMTHAPDAEWIAALANWFHIRPELLTRHVVIRRGDEVIDHWFRVSAGLNSRILGEPHVLGQVRAAYAQAADTGSLDSTLYALGRAAIRVGKRARAETAINNARRSIATLAVEHVRKAAKNLSGASVVVTGAGHLASDIVDELTRRGADKVVIAGRTKDRVRSLAGKYRAVALHLSDLSKTAAHADVLISCTGAPSYVVEPATIGTQCDRNLHIVDLSVPRNVDPDVGRLPRVALTTLEDILAGEAAHHTGIADAERIIDQERTRFEQCCRRRSEHRLVAREPCA